MTVKIPKINPKENGIAKLLRLTRRHRTGGFIAARPRANAPALLLNVTVFENTPIDLKRENHHETNGAPATTHP